MSHYIASILSTPLSFNSTCHLNDELSKGDPVDYAVVCRKEKKKEKKFKIKLKNVAAAAAAAAATQKGISIFDRVAGCVI